MNGGRAELRPRPQRILDRRFWLLKEEERRKRAEAVQPTGLEIAANELLYHNALDMVLQVLPHEPPKSWSSEEVLAAARKKATKIRKRLERWGAR